MTLIIITLFRRGNVIAVIVFGSVFALVYDRASLIVLIFDLQCQLKYRFYKPWFMQTHSSSDVLYHADFHHCIREGYIHIPFYTDLFQMETR